MPTQSFQMVEEAHFGGALFFLHFAMRKSEQSCNEKNLSRLLYLWGFALNLECDIRACRGEGMPYKKL